MQPKHPAYDADLVLFDAKAASISSAALNMLCSSSSFVSPTVHALCSSSRCVLLALHTSVCPCLAPAGVRATHIDLAVNLVPNLSADFNNPQLQANPPTDTNGHGTHVSGTVFGAWDNGATTAVGVVGRARAISCGCGVFFREACVARCLEYARSTRTRVINMSFFIGKFATLYPSGGPVRTMLERFCEDEDGLVVVAAGNDNQEVVERLPGGGQIRTYPQAFAADFAGGVVLAIGHTQR